MSLYIKQIEQLIILQRVDDEILQLQEVIEQAPKKISGIEEKIKIQSNQKEELNERIELLNQQKKKLYQEIEEDNAKIKKSKNKLMMVENSREYHAMMREMDNLEKTNRLREDEKVALEEDLESKANLSQVLEDEVQKMEKEHAELKKEMETKTREATQRLEQLSQERKNASQAIPAPILSRYEFIRHRLKNPIIAPVEESICSGCHISIPPQTFIELQKGVQIMSCPNCQRLIFWKNHFEQEEETVV
ncbi:MAG: hypothetical protein K9K64_15440 [Desulfohalobiaceae bacterium]|nr:hypothetical protein [Desulfohalobiaceae bacterium]